MILLSIFIFMGAMVMGHSLREYMVDPVQDYNDACQAFCKSPFSRGMGGGSSRNFYASERPPWPRGPQRARGKRSWLEMGSTKSRSILWLFPSGFDYLP